MLAIRMQRTGRKGHAQFRVIVQDGRAHPKSGRVVAYAGSYDPYTKVAQIDTELIGSYLSNGAQPSDRVAKLLKREGVKLPAWYKMAPPKKRAPKKAKESTKEPAPSPDSEPDTAPIEAEEQPASLADKSTQEQAEEKAPDEEAQPAKADKTETPAGPIPEQPVVGAEPAKPEDGELAEAEKTNSA